MHGLQVLASAKLSEEKINPATRDARFKKNRFDESDDPVVEVDHIGLDSWRADGEQVVVISPVNSDVRGAVPEFMLRSERKFLNDFAGRASERHRPSAVPEFRQLNERPRP